MQVFRLSVFLVKIQNFSADSNFGFLGSKVQRRAKSKEASFKYGRMLLHAVKLPRNAVSW